MVTGLLQDSVAAVIVVDDGTVFWGTALAETASRFGEIVFNTSLTGYQEIISDPSYAGQIVLMTNPHIGNYGSNPTDDESQRPRAVAIVTRSLARRPSNRRSTESFPAYLERNRVAAIENIDTRALTRHIRSIGASRAGVFTGPDAGCDVSELVGLVRESPAMVGRDLVAAVTTRQSYESPFMPETTAFRVAVVDFGVKTTILRRLASVGCSVTVFPATTTTDDILEIEPDGVMLSNGPGDPAAVDGAPQRVRELLGRTPVFGICLGYQILGLAMDGSTLKLPFGHHGANHPVIDLETGRVEITSQNHGFAVEFDSANETCVGTVELTHRNLNDGTLEGFKCRDVPAFGVQHHPEAGPGPHDAAHLFDRFTSLMSAFGTSGVT